MPEALPRHHLERLERIEAEQRFRRAVLWRASGLVLLSTCLALCLMAVGLASTSRQWGPASFWLGVFGANLGTAAAVAWAYRELEH